MGLHVILLGNPVDGLRVIGPFATHNDACEYAQGFIDDDWWITPLGAPE